LRTGCTRWLLRQTPRGQRPAGAAPLRVEQLPEAVLVETGAATFHLGRRTLAPLTRALVGGQELLDPASARMVLTDCRGYLGLAAAGPQVTWQAEPHLPPRSAATDLEIYQDSSGGENWRSRNHVNRHGRVPCSFRGYGARHAGREEHGLRASPVVAVEGEGR